jgi:cysteine-rich repeat protein
MSTDRGLTWSAPAFIAGTPPSATPLLTQSFNPQVAVADVGTVAVTYYDFRHDTPSAPPALTDYWLAYCDPGSADCTDPVSWREVRLTQDSFDTLQVPLTSVRYFLGDYMGLTSAGGDFLSLFIRSSPADPANAHFIRVFPTPFCGDSIIDSGEECDDGNSVSCDDCSATCQIEPFVCGDGDLNAGCEECDDANTTDGDGCSGICQVEQLQNEDQQKCINELNKNFAKVAKVQGKVIDKCLKDGAKDKLENQTIEECSTADNDGKVGKAKQKTITKASGKCSVPPDFGPTDPNTVNRVAIDKELGLIHDIFGSDLDTAILPQWGPFSDQSKCQLAVAKAAKKCQDAKLKVFNKCKKDGLKSKAGPPSVVLPVDTAGDLEQCMGFDPKGKTEKACDSTTGKIRSTINKKCGGVDFAGTFPELLTIPGCGTNDHEAVAACVDQIVECQACLALNQADGLSRDCDLFDNGAVDGSCGELPPICGDGVVNQPSEQCDPPDDDACPGQCTLPGQPLECMCVMENPIGAHKCVLEADPNNPANASNIVVATQALSFPPNTAVGAIDISCGTVDPATGKAACDCDLQSIEPFNLPGIGFICLTLGNPCPPGEIDCDGGNALDVDMQSDHNIGTCTGHVDCEAQCTAFCARDERFNSGCEGFCTEPPHDPCTEDADCLSNQGSCAGKDGLPHGHICGCECLTVGGVVSGPGGLYCNVSMNINVEIAEPCGDGDLFIALGTRCVPMTTEKAMAQVHNTNNTPDKDFPDPAFSASGSALPCWILATSTTTGLRMVGAVSFFDDYAVGDVQSQLSFTCQ